MRAFKSLTDRRRLAQLAAASGLAAILAPVFTGCGSPPPLIHRGAWSVSFIQPSSLKCKIGGHNTVLAGGDVTPDKQPPLIDDGGLLEPGNTSSAVTVTCSVIPSGAGFAVQASMSGEQKILTASIGELDPGASKDKPATGVISYQSPNTAVPFTQTDCIFYFGTNVQSVAAGKVFVTFECDKIAAATDNVCEIKPGYMAFDNCDVKEETK
jgi:hypothetical protein